MSGSVDIWGDCYKVATAVLKLQPSEFWGMTPMELDAMCQAHRESQPGYAAPPTAAEFAEWKRQIPDKVH